jgi:parvulin-like peptidyl-prolyl isomerase
VGAKGRQRKGATRASEADRAAGRQRLGLIVFGVVFVLLFIGFAVGQGLGSPSVPSGAVAIVEEVPSEIGTVTEEDYQKAFDRQVEGSKEKAPEPGTDKFQEVQEAALGELVETIWIQGEAEELGIEVTPKQIETELASIKKQSFPTPDAYQKFLDQSGFTQEDVDERVKVQILSTQIQQRIGGTSTQPSNEQIEEYFESEKDSQFTTPASRDVRVVINKDQAKADAAKALLDKDQSPAGWKQAAAKYSEDPTTKSKGGLQSGITEEFVKEPLKSAIFESATGELVGPVKYEGNYLVVEVVELTPKKVKSLGEVRSQITQTLSQEAQQESFSEFISDYQTTWRTRTYCASGYEVPQCANFEGDSHPANVPPACYEADPKTPATACPAPVQLTSPALPGTVTRLKPKGEPFPQRPFPESAEAAPAEALEGAPTAPPTGE